MHGGLFPSCLGTYPQAWLPHHEGRDGTQTDSGPPTQLLQSTASAPQGPSSPVNRMRLTHRAHAPIPAGLQHRVGEPHGRSAFWEARAAEVEPGEGAQGAGSGRSHWTAGNAQSWAVARLVRKLFAGRLKETLTFPENMEMETQSRVLND